MTASIDRRHFLAALPALAMAPRLLAQAGAPFRTNGLSQITLTVSDVPKSLDFYQGLFGMPVQARQGSTVLLRIGNGPRFIAINLREWLDRIGVATLYIELGSPRKNGYCESFNSSFGMNGDGAIMPSAPFLTQLKRSCRQHPTPASASPGQPMTAGL